MIIKKEIKKLSKIRKYICNAIKATYKSKRKKALKLYRKAAKLQYELALVQIVEKNPIYIHNLISSYYTAKESEDKVLIKEIEKKMIEYSDEISKSNGKMRDKKTTMLEKMKYEFKKAEWRD
ncbi:MAG: hypothetical protein ACTSU2_02415 [Promethearchaeota archaeon]